MNMSAEIIKDPDGHEIKVVKWKDLHVPPLPGIAARLENFKHFVARDDDILLASYPKTGTHWAQNIIKMIMNNSTKQADVTSGPQTFLEAVDGVDKVASPRFLSTHVPRRYVPEDIFNKNVKIVLVYRNPKDTAVSLYHYVRGHPQNNYKGSWEGYYQLFKSGQVVYGSWYDYILEWWEKENKNPRVLFVSYEDLKLHSFKEIKRISTFLGYERNDDFLSKVADECSFSKMHLAALDKVNEATGTPQNLMYRKGAIGDWKNHFTVAQNEQFDALHSARMKDLDFKVKFEIPTH